MVYVWIFPLETILYELSLVNLKFLPWGCISCSWHHDWSSYVLILASTIYPIMWRQIWFHSSADIMGSILLASMTIFLLCYLKTLMVQLRGLIEEIVKYSLSTIHCNGLMERNHGGHLPLFEDVCSSKLLKPTFTSFGDHCMNTCVQGHLRIYSIRPWGTGFG